VLVGWIAVVLAEVVQDGVFGARAAAWVIVISLCEQEVACPMPENWRASCPACGEETTWTGCSTGCCSASCPACGGETTWTGCSTGCCSAGCPAGGEETTWTGCATGCATGSGRGATMRCAVRRRASSLWALRTGQLTVAGRSATAPAAAIGRSAVSATAPAAAIGRSAVSAAAPAAAIGRSAVSATAASVASAAVAPRAGIPRSARICSSRACTACMSGDGRGESSWPMTGRNRAASNRSPLPRRTGVFGRAAGRIGVQSINAMRIEHMID